MHRDDLVRSVTSYVDAFNRRDLEGLVEMFSEAVTLHDWSLSASGKAEVVKAIEGIFASTSSLFVEVRTIVVDPEIGRVAVEMIITVNKSDKIEVTDLISFDQSQKISSVRAYKM